MIKKLRVTVDGKSFVVTVEMPDESGASAVAPPPPVSAPPTYSAPSQPAPAQAAPVAAKGASGPGQVTSPLAGRVIAILVTAGAAVKEGDHLLTIEAMKMNTAVAAPKSGKIAEILTAVGAAVDEGQVLARIEG